MPTSKQKGVLRGMLIALGVTIAALVAAVAMRPSPLQPEASPIAFALGWDALVAACLAISIAALARHRFFTPEDIDGGGLSGGTDTAHVLQAIIQNTLEQSVLAIATHLAWAATMPAAWQAAVPMAVLLFVAGRMLFARGYARGAPARAIGFGLTFYPSLAMLLAIGIHAIVSRIG